MGLIFEQLSLDLATVSALALATIYLYMRIVTYGYWKRRSIPFQEPTFPFGNISDLLCQKVSIGEMVQRVYNESHDKVVGIFAVTRPILVINDLEMVRTIFVKDFAHFTDHGVYIDEEADPLSGHLFSLGGEKWRNLRTKLSPVFTSGKLKASFESLLGCGKTLQKFMVAASERRDVVEVREIAARFNTDVIASVAFGLDINCMEKPDTPFRAMGRKAFALTLLNGVRNLATFVMPKVQKTFKLKAVDQDVEDFIMSVVRKTIDYREKNNVVRKDLLQLLLQLRNTGKVAEDDVWEATKLQKNDGSQTMSFNELAAQAWVFYAAGFETSSSTMSFCMYELARNPECQRKVQEEIDAISKKYNGEITYDSLAEMKYLENCIDETLRMYPIVPILNRECTKDYQFPGTKYRISKGTAVFIPLLGMQRDPKYYPDPLQFRPERFVDKANHSPLQQPFMSFGEGPRMCIGMRLAKIQVKIGLHMMLQNSDVHLAENMCDGALRFSAKSFVLAAESGINLRVQPRQRKV